MSSIDNHKKFLEAFACAHVSDGFRENDGDRMFDWFMKTQGSARLALAQVQELKDKGNGYFKQNNFDIAAACYDDACKLLSLSLGNFGGEDLQSLSGLAVSLLSNMAASALKLEEYRSAAGMCSMILETFPHNVKALFRRAVARMKLKRFSLAKLDLLEALVVEPSNKDVLRELEVVKGHLLIKENGKRILEVDTEACGDRKNKKPGQDKESDVRKVDSESAITEVVKEQGDVSKIENESAKMEESESVNMEETEAQSVCGADLMTNVRKNEQLSHKSILEFSNKGGGSSRLRIPAQSYQKMLLEGKTVSFYRKHDLSTLTIRILKGEDKKERDFMGEENKNKKRRRRGTRERKTKVTQTMNEVTNASEIIDVIPAFPNVSLSVTSHEAVSSSASSVCDNSTSPDTHISLDNTTGVVNDSSTTSASLVTEKASSVYSPAQNESNNDQPFLFSARSKKCKISSFVNPSCGQFSPLIFRYVSTNRVRKIWRMTTHKKYHSRGDESPRHSLSTFSKSRSLLRKFLRPRGVSVSCCRYSPQAHIPMKRKDMTSSMLYSGNALKKPRGLETPIPSLSSCNNNIVSVPYLEMQHSLACKAMLS